MVNHISKSASQSIWANTLASLPFPLSFTFFFHIYWGIVALQCCLNFCGVCWVVSVISDSLQPYRQALQVPLSMGFSRQEYQSGLLCPTPGDLSHPGIETTSLMSLALASRFFTTSATCEAQFLLYDEVIELYVYIYSLLLGPHTHPHRSPQSTELRSLCYTAASH